jgi:hypothetical protein
MIGVERIVPIIKVSDLRVALDSFSIEPRVAFFRPQPARIMGRCRSQPPPVPPRSSSSLDEAA